MIAAASRAPSYLQPRLKSTAASNTSQSATVSPSAASSPITNLGAASTRPSSRQLPSHPLSDKATASLIRRTLCSQSADKGAPIVDLLPPLTSRNDVDLQLYAFIAIIIKEFVYTWYAKITPDQTFVEEVVKIIAHCTRALEQRLRKVDLEALIFDELPELLDAHVRAYRTAFYPLHPLPLEANPREVYHSLWPSSALSPVPGADGSTSTLLQKDNEAAYRQLLVTGVLAVLLPTEDLENDCLTALVSQILSEMILGNGIGGKVCEPWLIWEVITNIAQAVQAQLPKSRAQVRVDKSLDSTGVVKPHAAVAGKVDRSGRFLQKTFWLILQYTFLAFTTVRFVIVTIASSFSMPSRLSHSSKLRGTSPVTENLQPPAWTSTTSPRGQRSPLKQPILSMKIWGCAAHLLDLDVRMPWLGATISMLQWFALRGPGGLGATDGIIDKFLSHAITTHVLNPALLPPLLRTARGALFPNNAPSVAPRRVTSTEEQRAIRLRCAESLLALVSGRVKDVFFGPVGSPDLGHAPDGGQGKEERDGRIRQVEEMLDTFGDLYCNRHLLYGLVELLVVRLIPEMEEKGVVELLGERLG